MLRNIVVGWWVGRVGCLTFLARCTNIDATQHSGGVVGGTSGCVNSMIFQSVPRTPAPLTAAWPCFLWAMGAQSNLKRPAAAEPKRTTKKPKDKVPEETEDVKPAAAEEEKSEAEPKSETEQKKDERVEQPEKPNNQRRSLQVRRERINKRKTKKKRPKQSPRSNPWGSKPSLGESSWTLHLLKRASRKEKKKKKKDRWQWGAVQQRRRNQTFP